MRPKERREAGEHDLFRSRLSDHRSGACAGEVRQAIDWRFLEERFGAAYRDSQGTRRCRRG